MNENYFSEKKTVMFIAVHYSIFFNLTLKFLKSLINELK